MTIPEEIEQFKTQLTQTNSEEEEAGLILELLKKYASVNSSDSKQYIDRLLHLAEKLDSGHFKAMALFYLANTNRLIGDYQAATELTAQALDLFEQLNDLEGQASAYSNSGNIFWHQGNYPAALKNHLKALEIRENLGDKLRMAGSYNNIGLIQIDQGNYPDALKNHLRSLQIKEDAGDKPGMSHSYLNIGLIHEHQNNYDEALKNYSLSLGIKEEIGDKWGMGSVYNNIGIIHYQRGDFPEALKNHEHALLIREAINDKQGVAYSLNSIGNNLACLGNYAEALSHHSRALQISQAIGHKRLILYSYLSIGEIHEKNGALAEAIENKLTGLELGEEIGDKVVIRECSLSLANSFTAAGNFERALQYYIKYHQMDSEILGELAQKQLTNLNFQHNMEQKEKQLEIEHLRNVELKKERDRSETLLLNILPAEVAEELKENGAADAKFFNDVTVLFTDFKGFTSVSEKLSPQQLVDELHTCFSAFDEIITKYNIEKIKTVGDAYLAVSGLPLPNPNHAENVVEAAIEINEFIAKRIKERESKVLPFGEDLGGAGSFEVRLGIHSGSVVAGIVGIKKFAYDIWGDTVNTAARMEQNSEAGKINISETTYQLVKDQFNCVYRGEIEAKNKGKMKMYFVAPL